MKRALLIASVSSLLFFALIALYGCGTNPSSGGGGGTTAYVPRILFIHGIADWGSAEGISAAPTGTDWQTIVQDRGSSVNLYTLSLSPDGGKALLLTYISSYMTLEVMNADGSGKSTVATGPNVYCIAWANDSQRIAFVSDLSGTATLYTKVLGSVSPVQISEVGNAQPSFSKSATYIAYVRGNDIWYRNADGSGSEMPVTSTTSNEFSPCFSPSDESALLFCRTEGSNRYVFEVNITNTFEVTKLNPAAPFTNIFAVPSNGILWPATDPSYVYLSARMSGDSYYRLYRVPVAGGTPEALTVDAYHAVDFRVFRDTSGIFYVRDTGGSPDLYNMGYDGSAQTRITSNETPDYFSAYWYP